MKPSKIVFFDGECGICSKSVEFIFSIDKSQLIYFAPLQSTIAKEKLTQNGITNPNPNTFYYLDGDIVYSKSTGVLKVLRDTQSFYQWFYFVIIVPRYIRDFVYDIVAKNRYSLIKKSTCQIPSKEFLQRVL
ncbi:MAG: DCC1-like thiol-disulfide oxidoreductase family protein [Campylobacterota bacterium]|nr:DCC1-like thiol-disulfide oxidoreductase family protein [Campylobacterota bacterium]